MQQSLYKHTQSRTTAKVAILILKHKNKGLDTRGWRIIQELHIATREEEMNSL